MTAKMKSGQNAEISLPRRRREYAVSAAATKGIVSHVAGDADILVTPDLEAGNMIAKQMIYLAGAESAGIVLGARVPIILTGRADGTLSRLASCALALLYIHFRRGSFK